MKLYPYNQKEPRIFRQSLMNYYPFSKEVREMALSQDHSEFNFDDLVFDGEQSQNNMKWTADYQLQIINETIQRLKNHRGKLRRREADVTISLERKRLFIDSKNFDFPNLKKAKSAKKSV